MNALIRCHCLNRGLMLAEAPLFERIKLVREGHAADLRLHGDEADALLEAAIDRLLQFVALVVVAVVAEHDDIDVVGIRRRVQTLDDRVVVRGEAEEAGLAGLFQPR